MKNIINNEIIHRLSGLANTAGIQAYVVGGFVRDTVLGRPNKDIDIVCIGNGNGIKLAKLFANSLGKNKKLSIFKNFGTAMVKTRDFEVEFVGARKESYRRESRKPLVEEGTLDEDLQRRDFTINAMAISLNEEDKGRFIDPFQGVEDIERQLIRTPLNPDITFSDDPLRMMRAIRFATQLDFSLFPETRNAIKKNKDRLSIVSKERIADELHKIMLSPRPSKGLRLLDDTGILEMLIPELTALKGVEVKEGKGHKDNFIHSLQVLDNIADNTDYLWLRWAALLHDIGKAKTKHFEPELGWTFHGHDFIGAKMIPPLFKRLKLPLHDKMKFVQKMVRLHLRPIALVENTVTDSAIRRLLMDGGDDIDDLMLLCKADITSKNQQKVKKYTQNFLLVEKKLKEVEESDRIRNWQPPIDGDTIMRIFDITPGKIIGDLKNALKEAILEGEVKNNYHEAYDFIIKKGAELGLQEKNFLRNV